MTTTTPGGLYELAVELDNMATQLEAIEIPETHLSHIVLVVRETLRKLVDVLETEGHRGAMAEHLSTDVDTETIAATAQAAGKVLRDGRSKPASIRAGGGDR